MNGVLELDERRVGAQVGDRFQICATSRTESAARKPSVHVSPVIERAEVRTRTGQSMAKPPLTRACPASIAESQPARTGAPVPVRNAGSGFHPVVQNGSSESSPRA